MRILQSSSAARRLAAAAEFVRSYPAGTEMLLVGATREAIDDFVRGLSNEAGATFGLHRFTLKQLASRFAEPVLAAQGFAPCGPLASEALATRATYEALRRDETPYFAPVARFPGFSASLAATLGEMRAAALDTARLAKQPAPAPEIAVFLGEYEARMEEARLADQAALFVAATAALGAEEPAAWVGLPLLLLDVAVESEVDKAFVTALAAKAPRVLATVPSGDDRTASALQGLAPPEGIDDDRDAEVSSLARLRRYLFSTETPPKSAADDAVRFFSAPGEGREAVEIARSILDEARAGIPFDEMAVFLRVPETYSPLLQTAFRRAAIPPYFARGTKRPDPAGRAFLAVLACKAEGLSAKRFAEFLSFAQLPVLQESGAPPDGREIWVGPQDESLGVAATNAANEADAAPAPDGQLELEFSASSAKQEKASTEVTDRAPAGSLPAPWKWEELLVEASVIGGADRWRRRLGGLENELQIKLAEAAAEEPGSARVFALERALEQLHHLEAFALPVIEALDALPEAATWGEWLDRLAALAPRILRRPERVLRVLAELQPMAVVGPVAIDEVRGVLQERLAFLEEDPPVRRYGRVFVATPDQARGRSFRVVFAVGLAERIFPQRPREDPLLLDAMRAKISGGLATQADRGQRERLLLRLAVGAAADRLYLSYPRVDVIQSRPRVTSFYGLDVARAVHGSIPDFEQFERDASALAGARLAWPAPPDPSRAIDASEHDLAVLWALLREEDPAKSEGRANYLTHLNPHLQRSLRGRYARWEMDKWTPQDGLFGKSDAIEEALAAQRLTRRPYSPSALEKYASCPYRFLLAAIHRLEPREEKVALERLDPLTRGNLFHRVQSEALRALAATDLLPVREENLASANAVLLRVLEEIARTFEDELVPAITRVWQDEITAIRTDLLSWLRRLAVDSPQWHPYRFEYGFGLPSDRERDPESSPDPVVLDGGMILRGAVDLVERSADGARLRVTDHKTGVDRTKPGLLVGGGESLQPVLYGLAVEAALNQPVSEARLFFCTSRGGFSERVVVLDSKARAQGREVLALIDRAIGDGVLVPAPREEACKFCDFRIVCGPWEEERARSKKAPVLGDLIELRGRP
jgi:CRISPR/Cas system-associated exonuclease Cas4 (RecB family)